MRHRRGSGKDWLRCDRGPCSRQASSPSVWRSPSPRGRGTGAGPPPSPAPPPPGGAPAPGLLPAPPFSASVPAGPVSGAPALAVPLVALGFLALAPRGGGAARAGVGG